MPDAGAQERRPSDRNLGAVVIVTLLVAAAASLYGHGLFLTNAGPLWRDEASTVAFAELPSLRAIGAMLRYDTAPLVMPLLLRGWTRLGLDSDISLRVLGAIIGCAVLAALWWNTRRHRAWLPVCTILLFALNGWVIRGGDWIRPMGLGMVFVVLAFTTLSAALEEPRPWRVVVAALCSVLAVQSIYSNAALVAGICLGGVAVGIASRSALRVVISAGTGVVAALSLLPYIPALQAGREWGVLVRARPDLTRMWIALQATHAWDAWGWGLLAVAAIGVAIARVAAPRKETRGAERDREHGLYAVVALGAGGIAFLALMRWSDLLTQPWYYLPFMALAAATLDVILGPLVRRPGPGIATCVALVAATLAHLFALGPVLRLRQTNIDLVAAKIEASATDRDLVVLTHWYYGVTFHRYYTGPAPWITIPPLEDTRIHRFDLLKRRMEEPNPMDSTLRAIAGTVARGGRIWVVGPLPSVDVGATRAPPPAPRSELGWDCEGYCDRWAQLVTVLAHKVENALLLPIKPSVPVSTFEDASLVVLYGSVVEPVVPSLPDQRTVPSNTSPSPSSRTK